jgi:hypothetical protein
MLAAFTVFNLTLDELQLGPRGQAASPLHRVAGALRLV